jgi:2-polyprenyl-6-methoxyphenol hydroxylase-like FAD-dependent oxidoreductase
MARIVVVGGGIGGLSVALLLGRGGHQVTVCERDPAPAPVSTDDAWTGWRRPGTPQARLGHSFLAGFRRELRRRLPDVLDAVLAAGAPQLDMTMWMADGVERVPQDRDLSIVRARRPVVEAVLRRAAEAEPTVQVHAGCRVRALLADPPRPRDVPRVTGVATSSGAISADVVIVCGGRSVPVARWFNAIGATAPKEQAESCGSACYTRYFRMRAADDDDGQRDAGPTIHRDPGYLLYEVWGADNRTFACEIAAPVSDQPLKLLREEATWMAVAAAMPEWQEWIDPERSQPITPGVDVMGTERNTLRRFVEDDRPLALGVQVIGDARCQTDSLFAWGCGNALMAAAAVSDAIAEHPADAEAQTLSLAAAVDEELEGRYAYSVARDRARDRVLRAEPRWDTVSTGIGLIDGVLLAAADHDADIYRAVYRWDLQLDRAADLELKAAVIERARKIVGDHTEPPLDTEGIPTRDQLLEAIAGSPGSRRRAASPGSLSSGN